MTENFRHCMWWLIELFVCNTHTDVRVQLHTNWSSVYIMQMESQAPSTDTKHSKPKTGDRQTSDWTAEYTTAQYPSKFLAAIEKHSHGPNPMQPCNVSKPIFFSRVPAKNSKSYRHLQQSRCSRTGHYSLQPSLHSFPPPPPHLHFQKFTFVPPKIQGILICFCIWIHL